MATRTPLPTPRFRTLGGTGIKVTAHGLGTMMFGAIGNPDHDDCVRIVHAALDAGINLVDTADMYSAGESEVIVGKALQGRRDDVVLATKGHFAMGDGPLCSGNSRRWLTRALDASLRRLQTDHVDLYQVHRPDAHTDLEETLGALTDFVRAGKIRAFGCSTFPAEQLVEAHHVAEQRGLMRFRTEQPPYSMLSRGIETSVLPTCQRLGMGVLTWSPLAAGFLSGRVRAGRPLPAGRAQVQPEVYDLATPAGRAKLEATEQLAQLAEALDVLLPELAVAFVLAHPAVTSAIIGPRTMAHLEAALAGAALVLDDAALDRIDAIVPPGTDLATNGRWISHALTDPALRRRNASDRAAAD